MLVTTAKNGLEAVNLVKRLGRTKRFRYGLDGYSKPAMDGLTATKHLLEIDPNLPTIELTAHAFPEDRLKYLSVVMIDHIAKPF